MGERAIETRSVSTQIRLRGGTAFASIGDVSLAQLSHRALELLGDPLECELEQLLICGALVIRNGAHYRIEGGVESWEELSAIAERLEGRCDCGALLSERAGLKVCRTCCREYRA